MVEVLPRSVKAGRSQLSRMASWKYWLRLSRGVIFRVISNGFYEISAQNYEKSAIFGCDLILINLKRGL